MFQSKTDQELVQGYLNGNEFCLRELITRYKTKIFTTIKLIVKDTSLAEDLFQETFIKVIDTLKSGKYKEEGRFLYWVIRIAHNLVIDYFRKRHRIPRATAIAGDDVFRVLQLYDENIEDRLLRDQSIESLRAMIYKLPPEQKEVLLMRHYCNLSFREIASITGVSVNTALGRMRYALNAMRKMLARSEAKLKVLA